MDDDVRAAVNLRIDLRIEEEYIPDMNQRLIVYREAAGARSEEEIDRWLDELQDRYGRPPGSVLNLADYSRIRVMADRLGIESIDREAQTVVFKFKEQTRLDPTRLVRLVGRRGDVTLAPPAILKLDLKRGPATGPATRGTASGRGSSGGRSWWTARARAGAVQPGFTKDEILKPVKEDPRAEDGVFSRVGGLLSELLDVG